VLNKKINKLWSTNHEVVFAHFDLPNIDSSRVFGQLLTLVAYISKTDTEIDKRKTAFTTTIDFTLNAETLVNFGSQTIKFCCLISNHLSVTLHLLHMYMIMQLRSGHVTLLRTKFQPLDCPPNRTYGAGRPHVGLCPIFLVFVLFF